MRILTAVIALCLVACDEPQVVDDAATVEREPVPTEEFLAPDPDDDPVDTIDPQRDEAWLARNEPNFETIRVEDMQLRSRPRVRFSWTVEERVDISRTNDVALALARVTWSEEGVQRARSADALWQVTRNVRARHCDTGERDVVVRRGRRIPIAISQCRSPTGELRDVERGMNLEGWEETELSALRRLSRFVTGMAPPHRQRGEWLSTLASCEEPPAGWLECVDEDNDGNNDGICNGTWTHFTRRCEELLERTRQLVDMQYPPRPCQGIPLAWGGRMDRMIMERRNRARERAGLQPLVPLECGDVENTYYGHPPRPELADATVVTDEHG